MIQRVANPSVEVHDLTVSYQHKPVLWDIDMSLPVGQLIGLVGPNGAGKSTLLKALIGLLKPQSGYVKLLGAALDQVRRRVSYMPQRALIDWDFPVSVYDVVMMGRYAHMGLLQWPSKEDKAIVLACLEHVGLSALADRQIGTLSGGQQQRVLFARLLAQEGELLLLDEPTSAVDAATEADLLALMRRMSQQGKTLLVVHHDLQTVQKHFDWGVLLNMRLVASGPVADSCTPELLRKTYGDHLGVLHQVGHLLQSRQLPVRQDQPR